MSGAVLLTPPEAAKRIGLSASTMAKLRCVGGGPRYVRLSVRRVGYAVEDLDLCLESRKFRVTSEYKQAA